MHLSLILKPRHAPLFILSLRILHIFLRMMRVSRVTVNWIIWCLDQFQDPEDIYFCKNMWGNQSGWYSQSIHETLLGHWGLYKCGSKVATTTQRGDLQRSRRPFWNPRADYVWAPERGDIKKDKKLSILSSSFSGILNTLLVSGACLLILGNHILKLVQVLNFVSGNAKIKKFWFLHCQKHRRGRHDTNSVFWIHQEKWTEKS